GYAETTLLPDGSGRLLQIGFDHLNAYLIAPDGSNVSIAVTGPMKNIQPGPYGCLVTDPATGNFYLSSDRGVYKLVFGRDGQGNIPSLNSELIPGSPATSYQGMVYRPVDGKFYSWNGGDKIFVFDPTNDSFTTIDTMGTVPSSTDPGNGKVLEKFV